MRQAPSTNTNSGTYVAMENGANVIELGDRSNSSYFAGKMAGGPIGPFFCQKELTATEVLDLYHIGAHVLGLA